MTADNQAIGDLSTTAADYGRSYYDGARLGAAGEYGWESDHWRTFFTGVADRIVGLVEPGTVLDVGCAKGLLVQALVARGVDARGSDISEFAIGAAHPDVAGRLHVASATEPIEGRYDLVTCIEVLEHMSAEDAQKAIDAMCAATDRILFSSTPSDFKESTHINVHPASHWAAWFAERGFYRRTDADVTFLTPWAVLFERADLSRRTIVERYESRLGPLSVEIREIRGALLETQRQLAEIEKASRTGRPDDAAILARHAELVARDNVIGLEAQVATLQNQLTRVRSRLASARERLKQRDEELSQLRASRSMRVGRAVLKPVSWLKR